MKRNLAIAAAGLVLTAACGTAAATGSSDSAKRTDAAACAAFLRVGHPGATLDTATVAQIRQAASQIDAIRATARLRSLLVNVANDLMVAASLRQAGMTIASSSIVGDASAVLVACGYPPVSQDTNAPA